MLRGNIIYHSVMPTIMKFIDKFGTCVCFLTGRYIFQAVHLWVASLIALPLRMNLQGPTSDPASLCYDPVRSCIKIIAVLMLAQYVSHSLTAMKNQVLAY